MGEKGLTENVMLEIDLALASHELIKVKAGRLPKQESKKLLQRLLKLQSPSLFR